MIREAALWRVHDLMSQSYLLYQNKHLLGARILLRSSFETLATLIYLNQITQQVLDDKLSFNDWGEKTSKLLLGSRHDNEMPQSINVITVIEKCEKRYPGLIKLYASLSESAHPSYEGLCQGYSKINHDEYETDFENRWSELHAAKHLNSIELCMLTFDYEYNDVWTGLIEKLETWIEINDHKLSMDIAK